MIAGSRRGRPGRRHGPRGRLPKRALGAIRRGCPADQEAPPPVPGEQPGRRGHNARSAVAKRGRVPPRARIFSWRRSTTASRSRSSTPQQTSRRSRPQRSRYLRNRSIGQRLTSGRTAGERRGQSTDRVSLPHTLIAVAHAGESTGLRPSDPAPRLHAGVSDAGAMPLGRPCSATDGRARRRRGRILLLDPEQPEQRVRAAETTPRHE